LLPLVGWEEPYDPQSDFRIHCPLTESESGLYFQQAHPLLTLENLKCIAPDFVNTKYEDFSLNKTYKPGEVVKFQNKIYRCKKEVMGVDPYGNFQPINLLADFNPSFELEENGKLKWWNLQSDDPNTFAIVHDGYTGKNSVYLASTALSGHPALRSKNVFNITKDHIYEFAIAAKAAPLNEEFAPKSAIDFGILNLVSHLITITNQNYEVQSYTYKALRSDNFYFQIATRQSSAIIDDVSVRDVTYEDAAVNVKDYWEEFDPFSNWLENKTKGSIHKAIMRFYNEKLLQKTAKGLCEKKTLFDGTGRLSATIPNKNNLVGFEIVPIRSMGVTTKINKIGLQFTEPGNYTLYLMHSSSDQPIRTLELTKLHRNAMEWFEFKDLILPYKSDNTDAGGSWYLVYSQSDLPEGSKAIRKDYDWSKGPCNGCSRNSFLAWQAWSKYLEIHPFYINNEVLGEEEGVHLWDIEDNVYTYDTNYGINLEVTVECDLTDFIIEQRYNFIDVISKQVAIDMLREFAYNASVRLNGLSVTASREENRMRLAGVPPP